MTEKRSVLTRHFLAIGCSILILPTSVFPGSATERLDAFYAKELKEFNVALEPHIEHIDKCLSELDSWLNAFDPVECVKFDEKKSEAINLITEIV